MTTFGSPYVPYKGLLFPTGYLNMRVSNNAVSVPWMVPQSTTPDPPRWFLSPRQRLLTHFTHTHFFHPCALGAAAVGFDDLTDSVESLGAVAPAVLLLPLCPVLSVTESSDLDWHAAPKPPARGTVKSFLQRLLPCHGSRFIPKDV